CGGCGVACAQGQVCANGACALMCVGGTTKCGNACVDTETDPAHCGGCNKICPVGQICAAEKCQGTASGCPYGTVECGGICVKTNVDPQNCGGCGIPCLPDEACSNGSCVPKCPGAMIACSGDCVDTKSDPAHCGDCYQACAPGQICSAGQCKLPCAGGTSPCGGKCADTQSDPANCGACGHACAPGESCALGACASDSPPDLCEGVDQSTPKVLYLSADDSNSMASPVHARESLRQGLAPVGPIRTYEFLNYYRIYYPAPCGNDLAIFPQMRPGAEPGSLDLQIAVRSPDARARRPMSLTFVLDTSGSMDGTSIERERAVVRALARSLQAGDRVSLVTWNETNNVVLAGYAVAGPDDPALLSAADALSTGGTTDLHAGLVAGYELAVQQHEKGRLSRVILVSDGGANVGVTDEQLIAQHSEDADEEGIYLVGVGTGPLYDYNDLLMDTVTDAGRGAYVYLDSPAEAYHMFVQRFDEVMEVAARSVQVAVSLPWYFKMKAYFGESYSSDPAEVKPQHLAPSDAMVFHQIVGACDPGRIDPADRVAVTASWLTPLDFVPMQVSRTLTIHELLAGSAAELRKGRAIVAYAEALKSGNHAALRQAFALAIQADAGSDPELAEIATLLTKHPAF
ncbi:MAG: VWA domain-containing protein, partial [Deltaproteobacteria bacterium]|nr:VWA domain-containing protein [Deltaproteobacteria bacterium]